MSRAMVERRLGELSGELRGLRDELRVAEEQLLHLAEMADEARLRALVSETAIADREHRDAARHAEAMTRHRDDVAARIRQIEAHQDELLDRLAADR